MLLPRWGQTAQQLFNIYSIRKVSRWWLTRRNKSWEVSVAAHKLAGGNLPKMKHGMEFLIFQGSCYSGYISPFVPSHISSLHTPSPSSSPPLEAPPHHTAVRDQSLQQQTHEVHGQIVSESSLEKQASCCWKEILVIILFTQAFLSLCITWSC